MRRFLKKAVAILSAGCIAAGLLAGCGSSGTTAAVNDQSSGQTTAEADHKAEVKLVSFAGKTLTVEYEGVEYTLDISKAIINTNVMHSGDTLLIYYDGELGDNPSKFSVISVENLDADKEDSEEIVGTLEEITMNSITIRLNDGRILTFNANNAEHSFSYGVDEGNWVTIIYDGELNGTDTTNLAVTKIHDEETEHTKRVKAQTVIEDVDDTVYVLENTYVRSSFMMASEVLGALPAGQEVKRTGRCNNGWDRIEYEGREAYVYGTLLTTNPNEVGVKQTTQNLSQKVKVKALSETVYVKSDANVRANYSTASASIGGLKAGTAVTRTGICDNGWSRIEYEGKDAYVYSDLLTTRNPNSEVDGVTITAVDETIYAVTDANVYESFSEDSEAIGTLKYGDHVVRTGICSNGWSRVICYNRDGYVRSDLISTTNPIQIVTVKIYVTDGWAWATTDANIRESFTVDSKAIGVLREGEKIKVTGYTDVNWTRVLYNGMTGYIHNDLLTTVSPEGPTATPMPKEPTAKPTTEPKKPTAKPTMEPKKPTAKPTTEPKKPTDKPTETPKKPTTVPETPTAVPDTPTAVPEMPTVVPEEPTVVPEEPTTVPEEPTAAPDIDDSSAESDASDGGSAESGTDSSGDASMESGTDLSEDGKTDSDMDESGEKGKTDSEKDASVSDSKSDGTQPSDEAVSEKEKGNGDTDSITGTVVGYDIDTVTIQVDDDSDSDDDKAEESGKDSDDGAEEESETDFGDGEAEEAGSDSEDGELDENSESGDGEDEYPSKDYDDVEGDEDTYYTFDITDASQDFKNGISEGNEVTVSYTGDLDDMGSVAATNVSDSGEDAAKESVYRGSVVSTTANTVTIKLDDEVSMTFNYDGLDKLELKEGDKVKVTADMGAASNDQNVIKASKVEKN